MSRRFGRPLAAVLPFFAMTSLATASFGQAPESAVALESRLYAPCCYNGTLDIHESDLARDLRKEIEIRLSRGETADTIQGDFVTRYGDKVLAARTDVPIRTAGILVAILAVFSALALVLGLRRWTQTEHEKDAAEPANTHGDRLRDELDARLDAELADLDN